MNPPDRVTPTGDLPERELLDRGHEVLEWIARYLREPESVPVLPRVAPGEITRSLPAEPPRAGEPLAKILRDFDERILPGITHWNHPGFMAYFATSSSTPGIVAEMLIAALDVKAMLWRTSPAATELEEVVTGWLRGMLGLPPDWWGILTDTASISTLLAFAAAREARDLRIRELGTAGRADLPALRVYASAEAHSSVDKAALTLGIGLANVVHVETDAEFRMQPDALAAAIARDRNAGFLPLACVATVGTTSSSSIDPVPAVAEICEREGVWLHVDAAYGGAAAIVPEMRSVLSGAERADSLVVNPHKWMFTPFDCSALFLRRPEVLRRAFSLVPEYLTSRDSSEVTNYMDYGTQLGRRFRALKLWMVIRAFGVDGLAARIREHCVIASEFAAWIDHDPSWERMAPVPFSLVCFRWAPPGTTEDERDARNEAILHAVNAGGEIFLSHTRLRGRYTLRLAIGNLRTERRHVARAWELLRAAAR